MKKLMATTAITAIMVGTGFVPSANAEIERPIPPSVIVESVQFRQRYPWNGLVDIDAKISCSDPTTNLAVYVAAWDNVKDRALTVKTIWVEGDETKNPDLTVTSGQRRFVWDARADNPGEISSDVSLSIQTSVRDMRYMVLDLSGGTNSTEFARSFRADVPEGGWTDEYKTDKFVMRLIPAGTFLMGSPEDEVGRYAVETQHIVTISKAFYMAVFELTGAQTAKILGGTSTNTTPYSSYRSTFRGAHIPYNWLSFSDVSPTSVAGVLRSKTGISTFDIPSEARWEYACRAGTTTAFNDGSNLLSTSVSWDENLSKLARYNISYGASSYYAEVGSYQPNAWGLYDMHGNAAEWCLDGAKAAHVTTYNYPYNLYPYPSTPVIDPVGNAPGATYSSEIYTFVIRGAGYQDFSSNSHSFASQYSGPNSIARRCRSAYRGVGFDTKVGAGCRLCCDADLTK